MNQSAFRYMGVFDLLIVAAFVGVFGPASLVRSLGMAAMTVAGLCALVAGMVKRVTLGPVALSWRGFAGATYLLFAVILPLNMAPAVLAGTAPTAELLVFGAAVVGGASLLFMGIDILRGGRHFRVTENVERVVGW